MRMRRRRGMAMFGKPISFISCALSPSIPPKGIKRKAGGRMLFLEEDSPFWRRILSRRLWLLYAEVEAKQGHCILNRPLGGKIIRCFFLSV